jgi:hypothetical protein
MHVTAVTRGTQASPQAIWDLFADIPGRTRWDDAIQHIEISGRFERGAVGAVKLKGQPTRRFEIIECDPPHCYTDRFFLPMGGRMDWLHTLREVDGGCEVTFNVSVSGPTSFILAPIMRRILGRELPPTVDKLVELAEDDTTTA